MHKEIVSSFTSWRMFESFPVWGNYELSCYWHSHTDFSFLLGKYLGVGLLGGTVTLCVTAWETDKLFSRVTGWTSLYPHQQWLRVPVSLHPYQSFILFCFPFSHLNWYVVISHFSLICISLSLIYVKDLFIWLFAMWFFGKMPVNSFAPFEKLDYTFSHCWVFWAL